MTNKEIRIMKHILWIKSLDLEQWAERRNSQEILPRLVRRLINSVSIYKSYSNFPADESVQHGGWDGILLNVTGINQYVPEGNSVWEFSVRSDIKTKADNDYEKRKNNPLNINKNECSFIFVTPRKYDNKNKWIEEKKKENVWKDVRFYDSDDLEQWLELCTPVNVWFSNLIENIPDDASDLDTFWKEYSESTLPHLIPELIINDKNDEKNIIYNWLKNQQACITFFAETKKDAIAFLICSIKLLSYNDQEEIFSHSLIVKNYDSWIKLVENKRRLFLIPLFNDSFSPNTALNNGHYVFFPVDQNLSDSINISKLKRKPLEDSLRSLGFSEDRVREYAHNSGGSINALKRLLSSKEIPEWAKPKTENILPQLILIGQWDESNKNDVEIIEKITNKKFKDLIVLLNFYLNMPDSPLKKIENKWSFKSREISWKYLNNTIQEFHLKIFKDIAIKVLREINPAFDMPIEEQWLANIQDKKLSYSNIIREGICDSIALLPSELTSNKSLSNYSKVIIIDIFKDGNYWKLWASLGKLLCLLAESSPDDFLDAVEKNMDTLKNLFYNDTNNTFIHSPHVNLLWALECLAWETKYLSRVSLILTELLNIDFKVNTSNRPENSLREIFLGWHPQTKADIEVRIEVLKLIAEKYPDKILNILISILPKAHSIAMPTYKPKWQNWLKNYEKKTTNVEIHKYTNSIYSLIIENIKIIKYDPKKIINLLDKSFPEDKIIEVLKILNGIIEKETDENQLYDIKIFLRGKIRDHRYFKNSWWALPEHIIEKLEEIFDKIKFSNPILEHKWLFTFHPQLIDTGFVYKQNESHGKDIEEIVNKKRIEIIKYFKSYYGLDMIFELSNSVNESQLVGYSLSQIIDQESEEIEILNKYFYGEVKNFKFLCGFIGGRVTINKDAWIIKYISKECLEKWSKEFLLDISFCQRPNKNLWTLLKNIDILDDYWKKINVQFLENKNDIEEAINELLKVNRPWNAFNLLTLSLDYDGESSSLHPELIYQVIENCLKSKFEDSNIDSMFSYYISKIIDVLDKSEKIEEDKIIMLEWQFLPFLEHSERGLKSLNNYISKKPDFFTEIICLLYRSKNDEDDQIIEDEQMKIKWDLAYKLIDYWNIIPGIQDNLIDNQRLLDWINESRDLCNSKGRLEIADVHIGRVLSHSPFGADKLWPALPIRDIFEQIKSDAMENGFLTGTINKRGVVTRELYEGGKQEEELSKKYKEWSEKLQIKWPRMAKILREVSNHYLNDSLRENNRAEFEEYLF